ncbi:MAG: DUF4869 domain-containing protein [Lachnospiraceae bacterium]|jgi:hypothetical protein|nr:DUF4869 domain-containing protein [Lachnospiraceae bacterium]
MLKIGYGHPEGIYFFIDSEFEELIEIEWLNDPFNQRVLRDIDGCFYNGVAMQDIKLGYSFPVFDISTGAKALIIVNALPEIEIWGTIFGDNCTDLLLELAEHKDVTIYLQHFLKFTPEKFRAFSLVQTRQYVDYDDYAKELAKEIIAVCM